MIKENKVKKMLAEGKTAVGTFIKCTDPAVTEVMALTGCFDFFCIDNEHTAMNKESLVNIIRAAELFDVVPIVRPRGSDAPQLLQALDAGAMGVQVPNINTAEEAKQVAMSTKYRPLGNRGYASSQRCAGFSQIPGPQYAKMANENVMTICYCETREAYANLDKILAVDGVDVIFIGPHDLSQAFDVIGDVGNPIVQDAIKTIIRKTNAAGKVAGIIATDGNDLKYWQEQGARFIILSSDFAMIQRSGKQFREQMGK